MFLLSISLGALGAACSSPQRSVDPEPAAESSRSPEQVAPADTAGAAETAEPAAEPDVEAVEPDVEAAEVEEAEAEPAEPAYDLEADLEERRQTARQTLGERVRLARASEVFLIVGHPGMSQRAFQRTLRFIDKTVAAYMNNRFAKLPERAVGVYLFASRRPYDAYCDEHYGGCGTPYGVYFSADRRIVMNIGPGAGTLSHELVHPILEADFPRAPNWIDEGIASLFERPSYPRPGEVHGLKNWRHPRVFQALRSKRERELAAMDRLFRLSDADFRGGNEDLYYAMARYVCQWLDERDMLWPFYQRWRDTYDQDPTGEAAFRAVVGQSPAEAHPAWARWVKRL